MTQADQAQPRPFNQKADLKNQTGSILILSLWIFTLLGLLALSLAFRGRLELKISTIRDAKGITPYSLLSAVNVARMKLEADEEEEADSRYDEWYGEGSKDKKRKEELDRLGDPARKFTYALSIDDEESRLNINAVPPQVLENFFELLKQQEGKKFLSNPEDLMGGILYWRGDSWFKKEEKKGAYYKKKPFESLEEIFLIPGVKEEDIPILMSYLTVFPQGKKIPFVINLNTAPNLILKAVIQSIPGNPDAHKKIYEQILAFREGKLEQQSQGLGLTGLDKQTGLPKLGWQEGGRGNLGIAPPNFESPFNKRKASSSLTDKKKEDKGPKDVLQKSEPKKYFVESDLNDVTLLYLLELPRSPDLLSIVVQLVPYLTVNSEYFRVRVTLSGEILKDFGSEVILGTDQEILAWRRI